MPSRRILAAITLAIVAAPFAQAEAKAQQQPKPQKQPPLQQRVKVLEDRATALEKRADDAEQRATKAELEKAYVERVETDTKAYYEKALEQVKWVVGLLLGSLALLASLATFRSVKWFDDRANRAIETAREELREEFSRQLQADLETLSKRNKDELDKQKEEIDQSFNKKAKYLRAISQYAFQFCQGLTFITTKAYKGAKKHFKLAIQTFVENRESLPVDHAKRAVANIFHAIKNDAPQEFTENATTELGDPIYEKLQDALDFAAKADEVPELAPIVTQWRNKEKPPAATS